MKSLLNPWALLLLCALSFFGKAEAQGVGSVSGLSLYCWQDSLALSTSQATKNWVTGNNMRSWEFFSVKPVGCDLLIKGGFSLNDTTWANKKYYKVTDGNTLSFGPDTKIHYIKYRAVSGTGALFVIGARRYAQ